MQLVSQKALRHSTAFQAWGMARGKANGLGNEAATGDLRDSTIRKVVGTNVIFLQ